MHIPIQRHTAPTIALLIICALFGCSQELSEEEKQQVASLEQELESVRGDRADAERGLQKYNGGLIRILAEMRLEVVKTTEALLQQRIAAIESGAEIEVVVPAVRPDSAQAARLAEEIVAQEQEVARARQEASSARGLIGALAQSTVFTQEQTLAMLQQKYLSAKYGLGLPIRHSGEVDSQSITSGGSASAGTEHESADYGIESDVLQVDILTKRFSEQDYQEYVWLDLKYSAIGLDRESRAIKGVLVFTDLFDEPRMRIRWTIDSPIQPGAESVERDVGFEYNQFTDSHQWVRNTSRESMKAVFLVESILYSDGSRKDF